MIKVQPRPATIRPLVSRFRHTVHAYFDKDPWDRAGRHLLYMAFDDPGEKFIVIQEEASGRETVLGPTQMNDLHGCAAQQWVLDDRAVLYAQAPGNWVLVYTAAPGQVVPVPALQETGVRQVLDHGAEVITTRIDKLNLETGQRTPLLNMEQALAELPDELRNAGAQYHFNHPVMNPERSRLFCKLMQSPPGPTTFCAFYTFEIATGRVHCLGNRISGHPFWMPDNRHILNLRTERPATGDPARDHNNPRFLVRVAADTGAVERLLDFEIEGPGHPSIAPDGRRVVTDIFPYDQSVSRLYVVDLEDREVFEVATLDHVFEGGAMDSMTRAQPHPVWAPCGRRVLANCNHGGERLQCQIVELAD